MDINSAVPGQLLAVNTHPVNWGTVILTYDGVDNNTSSSYFNGLGNVDLTQGGINDRFRIMFTAAHNAGGSLSLSVNNVGVAGSSISVPLPASAGPLDLRFADFQAFNFSSVGYIEVSFTMYPGESYTIDSIAAAVPEPTTTALILTGAWVLYLKRRLPLRAFRHS